MKKTMFFWMLMGIFCAFFLSACGSAGGGDEVSGEASYGSTVLKPILTISNLEGGSYEIAIDFGDMPEGTKFLKGQQTPNGIWDFYPVSDDCKIVINKWPGGYFEFSFGVIDNANVAHWADPVGQYVYPTNVPKAEQHFRVKLGEEQSAPPVVIVPPIVEPLHIFTVTGSTASMTFATIDGYIINVVKDGVATAVKVSDVVRIVWCGDIAGWDTSVNAKYKAALVLPITTFTVPVHDIGIVMIVTLDGSVYSLNTAKTQLPVGSYLDSRSLIGF